MTKLWLLRKIKEHFFRLRRSCSWFIFMYNNHNWDYSYLYTMIDKKLSEMEKCHRKYSRTLSRSSVCRQINLTRKYLAISQGFEFENAYKKFKEIYGELSMETIPYHNGSCTLKFKYSKCEYNSPKHKHADKISARLHRLEIYVMEKYRLKFHDMMKKYSTCWCD